MLSLNLLSIQWWSAFMNINTNERMNYKRYAYLQDASGHFYNPYNRGIVNNIKEFFNIKPTLLDEEVEQAVVYTV